MRKAGILTMMRVSLGIAFGPLSITGSLVSDSLLFAVPAAVGLAGGVGLLEEPAGWLLSTQPEMQRVIKINAKLRGTWCFIVDQFKPMTGRYRNAVGHAASLGGTTDQTAEGIWGYALRTFASWNLCEIVFSANGSRKVAKSQRKTAK